MKDRKGSNLVQESKLYLRIRIILGEGKPPEGEVQRTSPAEETNVGLLLNEKVRRQGGKDATECEYCEGVKRRGIKPGKVAEKQPNNWETLEVEKIVEKKLNYSKKRKPSVSNFEMQTA